MNAIFLSFSLSFFSIYLFSQPISLNPENPDYFARLHKFMNKANELGILVECVLFFEGMSWEDMPMNPKNNINKTKVIKAQDYMSLSNGNILGYQKKYVLKLVN
jgi:hypothetical protein